MTRTSQELQGALEAAEAALAWERKIPALLLALGIDLERTDDARQVYFSALAAVREYLNWDGGQAFVVTDSREIVTATPEECNVCSVPAGEWPSIGCILRSASSRALIDQAVKTGEPTWSLGNLRSPDSGGTQTTHGPSKVSISPWIALPIKQYDDRVIAVLVFCSRNSISQSDSLRRLCRLIAEKIGTTIALQDAIRREREHTTVLLNASKMSALGEVAAGVAHEIANPISVLATLCQIVRRLAVADPIDGKMLLEQVARIERSIQRVTSIISDLQGFSRDASRDPFVEAPLGGVLSQTLTLCRAKFMKDRIALHVDDIPSDWVVECRPSQVSQVLLNLLGNAHDAAHGTSGAWAKVEALDRGESFEIAVSNSGAPIPPEIADRVMDAFLPLSPPERARGSD